MICFPKAQEKEHNHDKRRYNITTLYTKMAKKTMDEILFHNNEGVSNLCRGRFKAAKACFRAALVGLNKCEMQLENSDEDDSATSSNSSFSRNMPQSCPFIISQRTLPNIRRRDGENQYYICRDALVVTNQNPDKEYDGDLYPILGAGLIGIVVFNLSLASLYIEHLGNGSAANLRMVTRTYTKVWEALENDDSLFAKNFPIQKELMMLATLNNMGIVFHRLENYDKAQRCFDTLKYICSRKTAGVQALQRDVRYGMAMNALFAEQPSPACAA